MKNCTLKGLQQVHDLESHSKSPEMAQFVMLYIASYLWSVLCSSNVSVLHCFSGITTFTVYMTACDLEKFLNFNNTVEITCHVHFLIHV